MSTRTWCSQRRLQTGGSCLGRPAAQGTRILKAAAPLPFSWPQARPASHGMVGPQDGPSEAVLPTSNSSVQIRKLGGGGGWSSRAQLLAPDLCPSRNRQTSAHQTAAVRPRGQPAYLSPVPGDEGGAACHQATPGAPGPPLRPPGSQPALTSACPGPRPLPQAGPLPSGPLCTPTSSPLGPQPPTWDVPPTPCLRGVGQGSPPGPSRCGCGSGMHAALPSRSLPPGGHRAQQ